METQDHRYPSKSNLRSMDWDGFVGAAVEWNRGGFCCRVRALRYLVWNNNDSPSVGAKVGLFDPRARIPWGLEQQTTASVTCLALSHTLLPTLLPKIHQELPALPRGRIHGNRIDRPGAQDMERSTISFFPSFRATFQRRFLLCKSQFIKELQTEQGLEVKGKSICSKDVTQCNKPVFLATEVP